MGALLINFFICLDEDDNSLRNQSNSIQGITNIKTGIETRWIIVSLLIDNQPHEVSLETIENGVTGFLTPQGSDRAIAKP